MVTDRGGLRYPVEVIDLFSANLTKFRAEVRASREEFAKFAAVSKTATRTSTTGQQAARRDEARADKIRAAAQKERLQRIREGIRQQALADKLRAAANRDQAREARRLATEESRASRSRQRANAAATRAARRAAEGQTRLRRSIKQTEGAANKLLFTFRRLVGVLALFTVARQVSAGFGALVKSGFEFNQTVEQSRLGIAGILVAVADIRDEQGNLVEGAEAFAAAQVLAREQMEKLRVDALNTTATFSELLDVFQIATGPGLAIGLDLNQIRQLSVLVSQAASNIGLQQNQLSEEIRAIFTGNIRQTTTRLAVVLGLTNEKIRELKALGPDVFFKDIQERLRGFALGASAAAETVGGLFVRLKDVIQLVSGTAAQESFETLRAILQRLFNSLTVLQSTKFGDLLRPDPDAQKAFNEIFDAIDAILLRASEVGAAIGLEGLTNSAQLFATLLQTVGILLVEVLGAAISGFSTLNKLLQPIISFFRELGGLLPAGVASFLLQQLLQIGVVLISLKIGFTLFAGAAAKAFTFLTKLPALLSATKVAIRTNIAGAIIWAGELKVVAFTMNVIRTRAFLIAGAFGVVAAGLLLVTKAVFGASASLTDLPAALDIAFQLTFTKIFTSIKLFVANIKFAARSGFSALVAETKILVAEIAFAFRSLTADSQREKALLAAAKAGVVDIIRTKEKKKQAAAALELKETEKELAQIDKDANKRAGDQTDKLKEQVALRKKEREEFEKQLADERAASGLSASGKREGVSDEQRKALQVAQSTNDQRRIELQLRRDINNLKDLDTSQDERDRQAADLKVIALQDQLRVLQQINQQELARFERENATLLDPKVSSPEVVANAQARLNELKEKQALTEADIAEKLKDQERAAERARLIAEGGIGEGLAAGLRDFADQFSSQFEAGLRIATGAMQRFANFVSTSIVDAFDPTKKFDLKERFARFLQDIAKLILQQLAQIAIAKAILGLGIGAPVGGAAQGGSIGLSRGGRVPSRHSRASLAHYGYGQGMASGGKARPPAGIDPRDNIPIWAQAGEFMMRVAAVQKYGNGVMEALNRGMIDPGALQALAGSRRFASRRRRTIGFQTGGEISTAARSAARATEGADASQSQGGGTNTAVLLANETTAERMLAGGKKAVLDFIDDNGADIDGRLARFRS